MPHPLLLVHYFSEAILSRRCSSGKPCSIVGARPASDPPFNPPVGGIPAPVASPYNESTGQEFLRRVGDTLGIWVVKEPQLIAGCGATAVPGVVAPQSP